MAEQRTKRLVRQEPYSYQWYLPSEKGDRPKVQLDMRNPDGYIDSVVVDESPVSMEEGVVGQEQFVEEFAATEELPRPTPHKIYRPKHRSMGRVSSLSKLHLGSSIRTRIVATAGWSAMAGTGAAALLTRAGPFPGTQLAELGAAWAGIAAFLWIAISKLSK